MEDPLNHFVDEFLRNLLNAEGKLSKRNLYVNKSANAGQCNELRKKYHFQAIHGQRNPSIFATEGLQATFNHIRRINNLKCASERCFYEPWSKNEICFFMLEYSK